jgi:cephalosporin hydroxylase
MDIYTYSSLLDIIRIAPRMLRYYVIYYSGIFILFIIWFLSIIIMQKLFTIKINKVYKIISFVVLFIVIFTLPLYIIYDLKKNSIYYFHGVFYKSLENSNIRWFGIPAQKNPLDMWVYQEIIYDIKPDIIIECGTFRGGSALFFANLFDLLENGKVITIDITEQKNRPQHNRIIYLQGSSTSDDIVGKVKSLITKNDRVLVSLDSDHRKQHVLNELNIYSQLVSKGSYIVVEDTNLNGNPVYPTFGEGPMEAVKEFMKNNSEFVVDRSREKYLLTFYPNGYLKKVK